LKNPVPINFQTHSMFYSLLAFLLHTTSFVTAKDNIQEKQEDQKVPQKAVCKELTWPQLSIPSLSRPNTWRWTMHTWLIRVKDFQFRKNQNARSQNPMFDIIPCW
jgi:hypothetical protein